MTDFASAAMLRVLAQGLRELGHEVPRAVDAACQHGAIVTLALKRELIAAAVAQGGLGCLAQLGRGLPRFVNDPTHRALAAARDVPDLFARWQRLQRYVHSRHHCAPIAQGVRHAVLRHAPLRAGSPPPLPAESLVVLGLVAALLEAIGVRGLQATLDGGVPAYPLADVRALESAAARGALPRWRFDWRERVPHAAPVAGVGGTPPVDALMPPPSWPAPVRVVFGGLLDHLAPSLPLAQLARRLDLTPRTLQRRLAEAGTSHRQLLAEARCRSAAWWLVHSPLSLAEVGFLSGHADQAHFTRALRARVGLTPGQYRRAFATDPAGRLAASG